MVRVLFLILGYGSIRQNSHCGSFARPTPVWKVLRDQDQVKVDKDTRVLGTHGERQRKLSVGMGLEIKY